MFEKSYAILQHRDHVQFVEMPSTHIYQLTALNRRLHKEIDKLTVDNVPELPHVIAECQKLEQIDQQIPFYSGLDYINQLEQEFSSLQEAAYPLISLLTEIRALQAQLEQWYEEEAEEQNM